MKFKNGAELAAWVKEAEAAISKYGFEDKVVYPYPNCPVKASKVITDCKDYSRCTKGSQEYLLMLADGFSDILKVWIEYAEAPKIKVRVISSGRVIEMLEKDLDMFDGLVEAI